MLVGLLSRLCLVLADIIAARPSPLV